MHTYEEIVECIVSFLTKVAGLEKSQSSIPWNAFLRLSDLIHSQFGIPFTTFTPIMRRLLFGIGYASHPGTIIGVGTYVGYTFSWLLRTRTDDEAPACFTTALGIDTDKGANGVARQNCEILGHGSRLRYLDAEGSAWIRASNMPIDLLYLDLDDPVTGKSGYESVLEGSLPYLRSGALVIAHDACVKAFDQDFTRYHNAIRNSGRFRGPWVFPVDACGLSVAKVR